MINLSHDDWMEIACALDSKVQSLRRGDYNMNDGLDETEAWIAHLLAIMEAIGPDGLDAAEQGVKAS